ncbi:ankyrin-3-like [Mytilus edulis]|uniref:ankyrin-3-like n=1 Tax=Mytilus edulis TaxID=6550 RepID=UPI0039EE1FFD
MTNIRYINDIDDRHMSAAFIAASHGNEHALQCLLDYGADPYFKVSFSSNNIRRFGTDLVHKCKHIYFCGYTILHIASQNGHIQTVEMLVERYHDKILSKRNSMNLTAFELAAENGHTVITTYLLNKKTSFANLLSLHHAAENGHSSVVKLLLENGVKDTCLLCNDSIYWIPDTHGRMQQDFTVKNIVMYENATTEELYKFYDDWYLITCDTALNAAVRNGHLKIVDILLNEKTNTLTCNAFDGKNPFMTAVQYNQSTILSHLFKYKADVTAKCRNNVYLNKRDLIILGKTERNSLIRIRCTNGMSIIHLLAVHWNRDMFYMLNLIKEVNFNDRDNNNARPLHYAFCHGNNEFIAIAMKLNFNLNVRSRNGSTPYHSAAICKSSTLHVLRTKYKCIIPDSKDVNGLSILQYGSLITYNHDGIKHSNGAFSVLFQTVFDSKHNINNTDVFGRNFLHYVATNGNYYSFISLFGSLSQDDFNMFILQRDKFGQTPVDNLFSSLPKREITEPFKLPLNCALTSIFYTGCKTNLQKILTPGETFIFLVVDYLYRAHFIQHFNLTNYIILSMNRMRLYPLLVLKAYAIVEFQNAVSNIPEIVHLLAGFEGPNIADIILSRENVIKCNGQVSPLHKIIQNDRGKFWTYSNKNSLSRLLGEYAARTLDNCVDKEGFNVLQRAAMGGNIVAVKYLIEKGMNVTVLSRQGNNLLNLAIVSSPVYEYGKVPTYYHNSTRIFLRLYILEKSNETQDYLQEEQENGSVDFSQTLAYILKVLFELPKTDLDMLKNQLCRSNKAKLGLMHLAASKGFLNICKHLFGVNILNCRDSNDITLYYMAHIYNQDHVMEWMDSLEVHNYRPSADIESFLLYNIIANYKIRKEFHWSCRLHYSYRYMHIFRLVYKRCSKIDKHYVLLKNPDVLEIFEKHRVLSFMNSKLNLIDDLTNLKSCFVNFDQRCSHKILILTIGMKRDKEMLRYLKRHLTKTMAFGLNDRVPILQILFNSRNVRPGSLSFLGLFEDKYKYLELLSVKSEIHLLMIESYVKKLQRNGGDLKRKSRAFYEEFKQNAFSNISKIFDTFDENLQALRNITMNKEIIPNN